MFYQDPRLFSTHPGFSPALGFSPTNTFAPSPSFVPAQTNESAYLFNRLEEMCVQIALIGELIRLQGGHHSAKAS